MTYSDQKDIQRDEDKFSFIALCVNPPGYIQEKFGEDFEEEFEEEHREGHNRYKEHLLKKYGVKTYEVAREIARDAHRSNTPKLQLAELERKATSDKIVGMRFIFTCIISIAALLASVAALYL